MKPITKFRYVDVIIQPVLGLTAIVFQLRDPYIAYSAFVLGAWQLTSNFINAYYNKRYDKITLLRKIYSWLTLLVFIWTIVAFVSLYLSQPIDNVDLFMYFLVSMIVIGFILAIFYYVISLIELIRAESNQH